MKKEKGAPAGQLEFRLHGNRHMSGCGEDMDHEKGWMSLGDSGPLAAILGHCRVRRDVPSCHCLWPVLRRSGESVLQRAHKETILTWTHSGIALRWGALRWWAEVIF